MLSVPLALALDPRGSQAGKGETPCCGFQASQALQISTWAGQYVLKLMALIKSKYNEQRSQMPLFVSFTELLMPIKLLAAVRLLQSLLHHFSKARS